MQLAVDIPDKFMIGTNQEEMTARVKLSTALVLFAEQRLSAGAACELAGIDRFAFLHECRSRGIPCVRYDSDALDQELASLERDRG